jgi:ketosteroid isomerase-like protein
MKKMKSSILLLICLHINILQVAGQVDLTPSDKVIAYLKTFRTEYARAMVNKKPELVEKAYDENVRLMPPFQKTILGKRNVVVYNKAFANRFDIISYNRKEVEVLDLGSQVIEIGNLNAKLILKSTGEQFDLAGKYLDIFKKLRNGELSLITQAWNFDAHYDNLNDHLKFEDIPSVAAAFLPNVHVNDNISFELAALNRLLDAAVTEHDANVWCRFYTDDSMQLSSYYPILRGKKEIDEYLKKHVVELPIFEGLDIRNDHIDHLGNYVIEYASHIASWKNGGSSGVNTGKNIRIWRREADHSLKMFRSIGMYD